MAEKVWLVTGVSTGIGRAIARAALDAGRTVVGTVRKEADRADYEAEAPGRAIGMLLDMSDHARVAPTVDAIERDIGPIGVAVNNAGYGHEGPLELISLADLKRQYDVNVFGAVALAQALIPHMRARRDGCIVNVSSGTAASMSPGIGAYSSSKAALTCLSEVLKGEVEPFGIRVTNIIPGMFRTDWASRSLSRSHTPGGEYAHLDEALDGRAEKFEKLGGDPAKFAAAVLDLAGMPAPPANLVLGDGAVSVDRQRIAKMQAEADAGAVRPSTDFD